ncbi:ABC transporter permease [Streptomyces sp. XM4193]|uniref:ABC transporter permease n=1 Tax=Streptomyces sp. XM4193 TaxID=2929782 RepID=UPI001FF79B1B|nr:ABC transporter permease [Streptomyces sp. XM4193]MCK1796389.1 ABC transporter permease [Streptomyces sp. XM4193]
MSSPTPASPDGSSQPYDPWGERSAAAGAAEPGAPDADDTGPTGPGELRDLALVAVPVTLLGVLLGLLWWWLAPQVPYLSDGKQAFLLNSEGEDTIGVDGVYVALAAGFGLLSGLLVFLLRRSGGIGVVVGLALGSALAAFVGRVVGSLLGPDADLAAAAARAGRGETFDGPLELNATIALLVWPLTALLAHLLVTALFGPRDPEPTVPVHTGWAAGPAAAAHPGGYGPYQGADAPPGAHPEHPNHPGHPDQAGHPDHPGHPNHPGHPDQADGSHRHGQPDQQGPYGGYGPPEAPEGPGRSY